MPDNGNDTMLVKQSGDPAEQSLQDRFHRERQGSGFPLLAFLAVAGNLVAPWWSKRRDSDLAAFWPKSGHLSGAFYTLACKLSSVPRHVLPRDPSVSAHRRLADQYQIILDEMVEGMGGWEALIVPTLLDRWCLAARTKIHLGGERRGQTKEIRDIVRDKDIGPVLTVDESGHLVEKNINQWHTTPLGDRRWWWISLERASMHGGKSAGGLHLTEDHPVQTDSGWVLARDVKPGMLVATPDPVPSSEQMQVITGAMLGDSSVAMIRKRATLRFSHSIEQEEWLDLKLESLQGFQWTGKKSYQGKPFNGYVGKPISGVNSRGSLGLLALRESWYPDGKKVVNRQDVEKYFSPRMLATWYCDDGSMGKNKTRAGNDTTPCGYFWTNGFSQSDVEWLVDLLNKNGVKCNLRNSYGYPTIHISSEGFRQLVKMIGSYIPPCMRYKLPNDAPAFDPSLWELEPAHIFYDKVVASEQRDYYMGNKVAQTTFHIGVEETRSYIAANMLVHNTQDNGWYWEVTGDGPKDGPIRGPATGLMHLDSWKCDRTGDYEFPVVYTDTDGRRYRLHTSRVIFDAELSDPRVDMLGVGHCWVSRIIDTAQNLVDIAQYKQEKLGSRPKRAIAITKGGLDPEDLATALRLADNQMTAAGLSRYSKMVIVGDRNIQNADITMLDMASLPDGFNELESTTLAMNLVALTGSVPLRWLWPASVTGATKADAEYQHIAGLTGGPGSTLARFANLLGGPSTGLTHVSGKFLPPSLKLEFDFQDDYQDYSVAQNRDLRSQQRERDLNSGVYTLRVAREQALDAGDITDAQFMEMELDDGRLENGAPILSLFANPEYNGLLDVGVADPLDVGANDKATVQAGIVLAEAEVMRLVAAPRNPSEGRQAKEALGALAALKELYKSVPKPKPVPPPPPVEGEVVPVEGEATPEESKPEAQPAEATPDSAGPFEVKSVASFGLSVRAAAKGYWSGQTDFFSFVNTLISAVLRGYEQAWREGAAVYGVQPEDRTAEEQQVLDGMINQAQSRVTAFADFVAQRTKALGGYWRDVLPRAELWTEQYEAVRARAQAMASQDQKEQWLLGATEKHCIDCAGVANRVYRGSVWNKYGWYPKSTALACHGFYCDCRREQTDLPITKGHPPTLRG